MRLSGWTTDGMSQPWTHGNLKGCQNRHAHSTTFWWNIPKLIRNRPKDIPLVCFCSSRSSFAPPVCFRSTTSLFLFHQSALVYSYTNIQVDMCTFNNKSYMYINMKEQASGANANWWSKRRLVAREHIQQHQTSRAKADLWDIFDSLLEQSTHGRPNIRMPPVFPMPTPPLLYFNHILLYTY